MYKLFGGQRNLTIFPALVISEQRGLTVGCPWTSIFRGPPKNRLITVNTARKGRLKAAEKLILIDSVLQ